MDKKKIVSISIITVSIVIAGIVFFKSSGSATGIGEYKGQMVYLKCVAPACGYVQEMDKTEYFQTIKEKYNNEERPFECEKCGGNALRAIKCEKCGDIFVRGVVRNDYADRCPKCGFSPSDAGK